MSGLQLIATGGAIPGRTVTNEDLSRMVDTSDEWITSRTGFPPNHFLTASICLQVPSLEVLKSMQEQ